jgi:acetyl esterase/lipase
MTKYIILALIAGVAAFGLWFSRWPGPQQLNFADLIYPGKIDMAHAVVTDIAYGNDDRQMLDIYRPAPTPAGGSHPVLVFFHGGSWRDGDRPGYAFLGRAFAARGFVTIVADYRKTPQHRFPAFAEDAAAAIAWSARHAKEYDGDPKRLFIMGHSAGAHIAMLAALDPKYLVGQKSNASAIKGVIGLAGPYDFLPFERETAKAAFAHWPRPNETQPISYARADAPPLLLLSGDADTTVKPRNSKALAATMVDIGGNAAVKIYSGVDHNGIIMAVARPFRGKAPVIEDVQRFVAQNSG